MHYLFNCEEVFQGGNEPFNDKAAHFKSSRLTCVVCAYSFCEPFLKWLTLPRSSFPLRMGGWKETNNTKFCGNNDNHLACLEVLMQKVAEENKGEEYVNF